MLDYDSWKKKTEDQEDAIASSSRIFLKNDPIFWEKFSNLANDNSEELAKLLDVKLEKVSKWHGIIKKLQLAMEQEKMAKKKNSSKKTG